MFVKKSQAEIAKMTDEQAEQYATEKATHDAEVQRKAIADAVSTAKEEIEKAIPTAVTEATKELVSKVEASEKANKELTDIVEKQGIELAKRPTSQADNGFSAGKEMADQLEALHKNVESASNQTKVTIKAPEYPDNAILVNTHNSIAGAIGAVGTYFAQVLGIYRKPVPKSTILDEVTVVPLNADRLVSISQTETVSVAITLEGQIKPVSNVVWSAFDVPAEAVASIFKTSTKLRRFFATFVQLFLSTMQDYFDKVIPQIIINAIRLYATPFTAVPAQQTVTDPNNWDALIAMIASLVKKGYAPNSARMSVFAWEAMVTQKATDGHYMLQNNGSINLLDKTVSFGDDVVVKIHADIEFGDDEVLVADLKNIFVGVDANTDYTEFYDAEDGKRNLLSHRLEKFIAVNIPVANRAGLTLDTFTNVKVAITAV